MACIQCNYEIIPENFLNIDSNICEECGAISNTLNLILKDVYIEYATNLHNKFKSIVPINNDGQIQFHNPNFIDRLSGEQIIKDKTNYLGIKGMSYESGKEIDNISNIIIGLILDDVKNLVDNNPKLYVLSLLSILEYCTHLVSVLVTWLNIKKSGLDVEAIECDYSKFMLKQLEFQKEYATTGNFGFIYKSWEGELSFDKYGFQNMIEIVNHFGVGKDLIVEKVDTVKLKKLIQYSRALENILFIKDEAKNIGKLEINNSGEMIVENKYDYEDFSESYVKSMVNRRRDSLSPEILNKFNAICKRYVGITLDDTFKVVSGLSKYFYNNDEFIICDIDNFILIIEKILKDVSGENIARFVNCLVYDNKNFSFAVDANLSNNRALRKCLIPIIGEIYACPVGLLINSIQGLYMDITNANLPESEFQKELFKIVDKKINKKFEENVGDFLKTELKEVHLKCNIENKKIPDINKKGQFIDFYGQIDILLVYKGKLFVVECKNPILKLTPKEINNEVNRYEKEGNKSYQIKLQKKIDSIYCNWESVIEYLNIPSTMAIEKQIPIGLFVTDTFNLSVLNNSLKFPIVMLYELINWLKVKVKVKEK